MQTVVGFGLDVILLFVYILMKDTTHWKNVEHATHTKKHASLRLHPSLTRWHALAAGKMKMRASLALKCTNKQKVPVQHQRVVCMGLCHTSYRQLA